MGWSLSLSFFALVYFILCSVYLLLGVSRRSQWQKASLKCLPIGSLLLLAVWTSQLEHQPSRGDTTSEQHVTEGRGETIRLLLLGLGLSIAGDALLVFRGTLGLLGVLSFSVAQCVYIALFGLTLERVAEQSFLGLLSGLGVFSLSLLILLVLSWRFSTVLKSGEHGMRRRFIGLVMPIALAYFVLISLMLWSSILQLQQAFNLLNVLGAVGGLLFYVSDILIAAGAIWQLRVLLHGRILVMTTYFGAQLLITISVVAT